MEVRLVQEHALLLATSQLKGGSPGRLGASRLSTNASLELSTSQLFRGSNMEVRLVQEHASLPTASQLKGGSPGRLGASRLSTNASLELSTLTIIQRVLFVGWLVA